MRISCATAILWALAADLAIGLVLWRVGAWIW